MIAFFSFTQAFVKLGFSQVEESGFFRLGNQYKHTYIKMDKITQGAKVKAEELEELNDVEFEGRGKKLSSIASSAFAGVIPGFEEKFGKQELQNDGEESDEDKTNDIEGAQDIEGVEGAQENPDQAEAGEGSEEPVKDYSYLIEQLTPILGEEELGDVEAIEASFAKILSEHQALTLEKDTFQSLTHLFDMSEDMVEVARLISEDGLEMPEALASVINFEEWQAELKDNDPDSYKKVVRRQFEREQRIKAEKKKKQDAKELMEKNASVSETNWNEFLKTKELDKKGGNEFKGQINRIFSNIANGLIDNEFLEVMYKGLSYDKNVQQKVDEATVKAKNDAIEEVKKAKQKTGDGTPNLQSGGSLRQRSEASRGKKALVGAVSSSANTDWR
jgi:hypothetical protein